jgi:hypothetical protein
MMVNTGSVVRIVETSNAFGILVGNPDVKLPLGRPRQRRYDTIKGDAEKIRYGDLDSIRLA